MRIIVTTGEGKFFTAGLDLLDPSVQQTPPLEPATISDEFIATIEKIHAFLIQTEKIVVSAVNGPAPGWGTTHIALSDLVYASATAVFFTPFVQWGFCAEGVSSLTFGRVMGRQKASGLILAGQRVTAGEMERAGLVTKVLGGEDGKGFWEEVCGVVRGMASLPGESLKVNKELMMRWVGKDELLEANRVECAWLRKQVRKRESLDAVKGHVEAAEKKKREKAAKAKM